MPRKREAAAPLDIACIEKRLQKVNSKLERIYQRRQIVLNHNGKNIQSKLDRLARIEEKWNNRKIWLEAHQVKGIENDIEKELFSMDDECVVCMAMERDATIVHGDTGHVACCFTCATAIWKSESPICPICNVKIDSVIRQFHA